MRSKSPTRTAIVAATLLAATTASADAQQGFYGQVEYGRTSIDESLDANGVPLSLDDSASGWRAALGYSFTPYFSVEGGYNDFGSVSSSGQVATVGASADGLELGLVFRWPASDRFTLSARSGYLWWDSETHVGAVSAGDSGNEVFAGLSAEFDIGERTAITAGWTRYRLDDLDLDRFHAGFRWYFGAGN